MQAVSTTMAVSRLSEEIAKYGWDDLRAIHNELFPRQPVTEVAAKQDAAAVRRRIVDRFQAGLELDEIIDLWNVVFPNSWNVYYDETSDEIHYDDAPQPAEWFE